jgi:hypothetical protein
MPANTPKGYPYPLGTDRLMDGDDAIHNLATAVDTKLGVAAAGQAVLPSGSVGTVVSVAVTFPAGLFTASPICMATYNGTSSSVLMALAVSSISVTGTTIFGGRASGSAGSVNVWWHAIQMS